ncbi:MAG: response regulator [Desulfovibrio sp.]|nr:response regulator [Desulfovibrio sp.]
METVETNLRHGEQSKPSSVVIIDDNKLKSAFLANILKEDFEVHAFTNAAAAICQLSAIGPRCILLDLERPGEDGFQTIADIKAHPGMAAVPLILITSTSDAETERRVLASGVADFVGNQFSQEIIRTRVMHQIELYNYRCDLERLVSEKTRNVEELQDAIMVGFSYLVEQRDLTTSGHAQRTKAYLRCLIKECQLREIYSRELTPELVNDIIRAAPLHDMGKVGVRDAVLNKPAALTPDEFAEMKQHPGYGATAVSMMMQGLHNSSFLNVLHDVIYTHHERWDGSGYPRGLAGREIPLSGRLMAIADVYDSLINRRPYKPSMSHEEAVASICEGIGSHFDPLLGHVFLECADEFAEIAAAHRKADTAGQPL